MIRTLVIVPTRNRAQLASAAVSSVLRQGVATRILVSDNSTEATEAEALRRFCSGLDPDRVTYARPPQPLPMTPHWEWALDLGLRQGIFTHVTYLTDRMVFKDGALADIIELAQRHPAAVISYNHDSIDDDRRPVLLLERDWSGNLYEIPSAHLLGLCARAVIPPCLPRMLNSIAPLEALGPLRRRFGSVFGSICPDFTFAYRLLATFPSFLYYDRPALIHYALDRSNGATYARGIASKDHLDFLANLGGAAHSGHAPVPAFKTATNPVFSEYCAVRESAGPDLFPKLDRFQYLGMTAWDARGIRDPRLAAATAALLRAQGWRRRDLVAWLVPRLAGYFRADLVGAVRGGLRRPPRFENAQAAIEYASRHPRPARPSARHFYTWFLFEPPGVVREVKAASAPSIPLGRTG